MTDILLASRHDCKVFLRPPTFIFLMTSMQADRALPPANSGLTGGGQQSFCINGSSVVPDFFGFAAFLAQGLRGLFLITMMLMRRLMGLTGSSLSNSTAELKPTTRMIFCSFMPPVTSSRREALARSADSSQLL